MRKEGIAQQEFCNTSQYKAAGITPILSYGGL